MTTEGLTQPELASVLRSTSFTRSLAQVALHTEATRFEGGFVVGRDEAGFVLSPTVLAQESGARPYGVGSDESAEAGMVLPRIPRLVASLHSHPYFRPLTPTDLTNIQPSPDDVLHMQHAQQRCPTYIAGIADLRARGGLLLALYRTTRPLPQVRDELLGHYDRAMEGNFEAVLEERLGIRSAHLPFDLRRGRILPPRAIPPRGLRRLDAAIAPLFAE